MAKQKHLDILKQGVDAWNTWISEHIDIKPNFRRANLKETDLRGAYLIGADLSYANLKEAELNETHLKGADLSGADLNSAILVRTVALDANFTDCRVYGISAWDVQLDGAQQIGLIITPEGQPTISVDSLEVAQFIYLLLQYEKLRDVLNSVVERGVLTLGRFGDGGLELLQAIAAKLRELQYLPIIFDFDRQEGRNLIETTMTLVGLSRFVIVDLSGPSVPYELGRLIPNFKLPFIPIIEEDRRKQIFSMFPELFENNCVLPLVAFRSKEHLLELLPLKIIEPAEEKFKERQILLNQLFSR